MAHTHDALTHRRDQTLAERYADGIIHVAGLTAALTGAIILVHVAASHDGPGRTASVVVYALGAIATFAASAAYNIGYYSPFRAILRRLDHAAIFVMIAGTYTPLLTHVISGILGFASTIAIWLTATFGIGLKLMRPKQFERIGVGLYLIIGWIGVAVFAPYALGLPGSSLSALVAGGLLYTAGVLFHVSDNMPFQNAIWHAFVLAAATCQWFGILTGVVLT